MIEWPDYYILVDRTPIAVDVMTWAEQFRKIDNRRIAEDNFDGVQVSTVFLGLNHQMRAHGEPILFETMIFGGPLNNSRWRYSTYAEAERGHQQALSEAKKAALQIKAIADAAGAKQ